MRYGIRLIVVLGSILMGISACLGLEGARHEYLMRGQVVEVTEDQVVVCVGSRDGARVGQELAVYKISTANVGGSPKNPARWEKVKVGSVRIDKVVDDHFAVAQVVSGQVRVNQIVQLDR